MFIHWPNVWQSGRHCANKGATRSVQSRPRIDSKTDKQTEKESGREREGREADNPLDKAKQSSKVSLLNVRGSTGDLN